jgi:glycerate kinase
MKIVTAPQAFKGSLSALEVCLAMEKGIRQVFPKASIVQVPLADGGDGTLEILLRIKEGKLKSSKVQNAIGKPITASWGILNDKATAIIELAQACGLARLLPEERNPLHTHTYGVGQLIEEALDGGCRHFLIGIGGSATNDAGTGMLKALGAQFLDSQGQELPLGGVALQNLSKIDLSGLDQRLKESIFSVACDVSNPLIGEKGAAMTYAGQKGASLPMVLQLEKAMMHFAKIVKRDFGVDLSSIPFGGAAGGLGAGIKAFLKAELCCGSELMTDLVELDKKLEGANLVIVGEGRMDAQTVYSKTPFTVAKKAKAQKIPVLAIVGSLGEGYRLLHEEGIEAIIPLAFESQKASSNTAELIASATEEALRCARLFTKQSSLI